LIVENNSALGKIQWMVSREIPVLGEDWPEYRLVIPADEPVSRQVKYLRMKWESMYGKTEAADRPPSITLACFTARVEMETTFLRWLQRICENHPAFPVALNNIGALPPHIIYIKVQDEAPFKRLAGQLRSLADFMEEKRIFEKPFIRLGSMPEEAHPGIWLRYTHQIFHAAFMARKLVLQKREGAEWRILCQFAFRGSVPDT
jgi:2'-5' RNA ligase